MVSRRGCLFALLAGGVAAAPVAIGQYESLVRDKYLFLFYNTWWCGDPCTSVEEAWRRLEAKMRGHERVFVGEIDCADVTEVLCKNVTGDYPQIGVGAAGTRLELYSGGRDAASLEALADARLPAIAALPPPAPPPRPAPTLLEQRVNQADLLKSFLTGGPFKKKTRLSEL